MSPREQTVDVEGRRIRVSHLDKVLYPAVGTTKAEVIDYYARIAPLLLPHLDGRPVTRKRWPDGVDTEPFFAKNLERGAPEWLRRQSIEHSTGTKDYVLVDDVPTLVWLAQTASLELHTPQWRFDADGHPSDPDRLVLDLDPGDDIDLPVVAEVARWARAILTDAGLVPFPVTSGSKGIHLYCALPAGQTSEAASALAKELARSLEADHPDLVVSSMSRALRPGKVFVDWSQNNGKKTTIAPYSLRGRARPTVAAPRTWEELDDPGLAQLDFIEVLARAEKDGDPLPALRPRRGSAEPLRTYISKRSADRTPEPVPSDPAADPASAGAPRFVIQEHHARRLHYDLRLEHDGVFVSWAVPKGVPETVKRNHLAVMTEDHPLSYGTFEGRIPAGEYGAGEVTIWDAGTYEAEKWRADEVIFTVSGRKGGPLGTARLALIRTDGEGEKSTWLLHRMKDHTAPVAVSAALWPDELSPSRLRPMLAENSTAGLAAAAARRWGEAWAEMKWDGVRALAFWDGERMLLRARSGTDITERYPELTADPGLGRAACILDGEIVALDERGRPSFPLLQSRMHLAKAAEIRREVERVPVHLHLFDVLALDGEDLTALPLRERRTRLEGLARDLNAPWVVPPVFDDLDAALEASTAFSLEGVMVKNPASVYRPGRRSDQWLKIKHVAMQEVVIGAIRPGRNGRGGIGSLLMGVPSPDGLRYVGRVGTGFSERELRRLDEVLQPLRTDASPFLDVPHADASDALWVRPEILAEVGYAEVTPDGRLRQARWRGLRPDKNPDEVRDET